MHFTTVTANPCVDRTIQVDSVNLGHSHRIQKTICDFSGKGINVSLALTQLGMPVKSVCLSHSDGEAADFFKQREMDAELIPVPGNVRINIKLFETSTGCMTEFNEKGTPLHPETAVDVIRAVPAISSTFNLRTERTHSLRKQCIRLYKCLFCAAKCLLGTPQTLSLCTVPMQAAHSCGTLFTR